MASGSSKNMLMWIFSHHIQIVDFVDTLCIQEQPILTRNLLWLTLKNTSKTSWSLFLSSSKTFNSLLVIAWMTIWLWSSPITTMVQLIRFFFYHDRRGKIKCWVLSMYYCLLVIVTTTTVLVKVKVFLKNYLRLNLKLCLPQVMGQHKWLKQPMCHTSLLPLGHAVATLLYECLCMY